MMSAEMSKDEEMRLLDLVSYGLLDHGTEQDFDEISKMVALYFNCPIALITFIDNDRQWFKGKTGTTETGNARSLSFCSHTLLLDDVMVVEDATKDERFYNNPFVAGEFNIRFYAGAPIVSTDGYKLGTICIYNTKPQKFSALKKNALMLFSKQVTKLLELKKKNAMLLQRAEEIIRFKTEIFANFMQDTENYRKEIAYNLHEEYAQVIAASMMNLQLAKNSKNQRVDFIDNAILQLKNVLTDMRTFSYSITPHIPNWISPEELLVDYINKIAPAFSFKINTHSAYSSNPVSTEITLCAIRIIEQWLKVLENKKTVNNVHISLALEDEFVLCIQDDGAVENLPEHKKEILKSMVYDRAHAQGGTVELTLADTGKNLLKIFLPLNNKIK